MALSQWHGMHVVQEVEPKKASNLHVSHVLALQFYMRVSLRPQIAQNEISNHRTEQIILKYAFGSTDI